jgi:ABC-type transporter Mla subunit MlaD
MKNKSDALVAIIVILSSMTLLAALLFSITGNPFQKPYLRFTVDFEDVTGIQRNSDVYYAGSRVGVIDSIEHVTSDQRVDPDMTIRAHVSILEDVPIAANIDVTIASESLLGEKHLALRRIDDTQGLLTEGAQLISKGPESTLDTMIPGAHEIVSNLDSILKSLRSFTEKLDGGTYGKSITEVLANLQELSSSLKTAVDGDGAGVIGIREKFSTVTDDLSAFAVELKEMVSGPEGNRAEGLSSRAKRTMESLERFSRELNETVAGNERGEPGLSAKLNKIADEVQVILSGSEDESEAGLRQNLDGVLTKVDNLVLELQTLIIWGEYFTGSVAERPNRIVFGGAENDVPTKEQILEYLREHQKPYPVQIKGNDPEGDPQFEAPASTSTDETGKKEPGKGIFERLRQRKKK